MADYNDVEAVIDQWRRLQLALTEVSSMLPLPDPPNKEAVANYKEATERAVEHARAARDAIARAMRLDWPPCPRQFLDAGPRDGDQWYAWAAHTTGKIETIDREFQWDSKTKVWLDKEVQAIDSSCDDVLYRWLDRIQDSKSANG